MFQQTNRTHTDENLRNFSFFGKGGAGFRFQQHKSPYSQAASNATSNIVPFKNCIARMANAALCKVIKPTSEVQTGQFEQSVTFKSFKSVKLKIYLAIRTSRFWVTAVKFAFLQMKICSFNQQSNYPKSLKSNIRRATMSQEKPIWAKIIGFCLPMFGFVCLSLNTSKISFL